MRLLLLALVAACATEPTVLPNDPPVTSGVMRMQIPVATSGRLDVLLVIDDSTAMAAYRERVGGDVRRFVELLRALDGGLPDLRLAVTAACATGELRRDPQLIGNFVADFVGPDGARLRGYRGELGDLVARLADVGASCGDPQPLLAGQRALASYDNRSFARDHTQLLVLTLGTHPIGTATGLPARARVLDVDIATGDWSAVADELRYGRKTTLGSPCIDGPLLDVDAATPGHQPACVAWYDFPIGGPLVRACADGVAGACWRIVEDRVQCDRGGLLRIESPPDIPDGTVLNIECLTR